MNRIVNFHKNQCLISLSGKANFLWLRRFRSFVPEGNMRLCFSPQAVVAGVILSNILPYLQTIYNLPNLWRQNQYDCVSVDTLAKVGKDKGEGWRERKTSTWRTLAILGCWIPKLKKSSQSCWCMEILRPHSSYAKLSGYSYMQI